MLASVKILRLSDVFKNLKEIEIRETLEDLACVTQDKLEEIVF